MRIVVQRVKKAAVAVGGEKIAFIENGFLLLVGIDSADTQQIAEKMAEKISGLRVFEDTAGKMNLNLSQVKGKVLSVPQFTLLANTSKGTRPGFENAAKPDKAKDLWKSFNTALKKTEIPVLEGKFGAHMEVSMVNDGPVTFVIDLK
ncbi:MAG: D-tyrosyl-tRNA(Tyr) deacylase [Candidatus Omnitrophica bacterium]|nr:D-tyrosyl-tRNA(Tyr) deacylase [Candidatus Omnitrophota bacterium]